MKTRKNVMKGAAALLLAAGIVVSGMTPAMAATDRTYGVVGNTKPACQARFSALIQNAHARGDSIIRYNSCMRLGNLWSASITIRR